MFGQKKKTKLYPPESLPDPGPILLLTATVDADGNSRVRYNGDPQWAIATLRQMADNVESDILGGQDVEPGEFPVDGPSEGRTMPRRPFEDRTGR